MKEQKIKGVYFVVSILLMMVVHATPIKPIQSINPIVDLRAPLSLFEMLHNGINTIYVSLEFCRNSYSDIVETVQSLQSGFDRLFFDYDSMVNTTRNHQVYNSDKEFLQKMIDRINNLIDELENKDDANKNQETEEALRTVRLFCDNLKAKISV